MKKEQSASTNILVDRVVYPAFLFFVFIIFCIGIILLVFNANASKVQYTHAKNILLLELQKVLYELELEHLEYQNSNKFIQYAVKSKNKSWINRELEKNMRINTLIVVEPDNKVLYKYENGKFIENTRLVDYPDLFKFVNKVRSMDGVSKSIGGFTLSNENLNLVSATIYKEQESLGAGKVIFMIREIDAYNLKFLADKVGINNIKIINDKFSVDDYKQYPLQNVEEEVIGYLSFESKYEDSNLIQMGIPIFIFIVCIFIISSQIIYGYFVRTVKEIDEHYLGKIGKEQEKIKGLELDLSMKKELLNKLTITCEKISDELSKNIELIKNDKQELSYKQKKHLEEVGNYNDEIKEIMKDILELVELEKGEMKLDIKSVSLKKIVYKFNESVGKGVISSKAELGDNCLLADEEKLFKILSFLKSVLKEDKTIWIEVSENRIRFVSSNLKESVYNTEIEISMIKNVNLFVSVYLPMIKKMVDLMNGKVEINLNKIIIEFILVPKVKEEVFLKGQANELSKKCFNVLYVEDDEVNVELMRGIFKNCFKEANLDIAYSAEECENVFLNKKYDIICIDLKLPRIDGITLAKRIKNELNVPLVAISGHVKKMDSEEVKEIFNYGINKPFNIQEVTDCFSKCLNSRG